MASTFSSGLSSARTSSSELALQVFGGGTAVAVTPPSAILPPQFIHDARGLPRTSSAQQNAPDHIAIGQPNFGKARPAGEPSAITFTAASFASHSRRRGRPFARDNPP